MDGMMRRLGRASFVRPVWAGGAWLVASLLTSLAVAPSHAGDWPHWRGPFYNGSADEKGLPETFSQTENVLWAADMPGESAATPIVVGNRVFVSSTDKDGRGLYAISLDRDTGEPLWNKKVGETERRNPSNTMASPSPVADDERAYFLYGTGDLVALDRQGEAAWSRDLAKDFGPLAILWTYSSSPLLYQGKLYVIMIRNTESGRWGEVKEGQSLDSFLLCIDPKTGKDLWKHTRPTDATGECLEAYTTPIPHEFQGRSEILVIGGDHLTGHDPKTGTEIWRQAYNPDKQGMWRLVPSPVAGGGFVFGVQPRANALFAVKAGRSGEIPYSEAAWTFPGPSPDTSTPLFYKDRLYVLGGDGKDKVITCLDPKTGRQIWQGKLEGRAPYRASPTGADDRIYLINMSGEAVALAAGDEFKVLSRASMGGDSDAATITAADGKLFIRTTEKLFCVGKKRGPQ
jgi:outer membrane protein assembly factor BamB